MTVRDQQRRTGVFVIPPVTPDAVALSRAVIDAGARVERAGFDSFWLAEGHFTHIGVSSALTVLAAVSQVTDRVRLGTAVVPVAFDDPLRLAETAATVHALSAGRVELGVGKGNGHGFSAHAYAAFHLAESDREQLYATALGRLREYLRDGALIDKALVPLFPPSGDLSHRIWQATSSRETAVAAARAGDGLQLHRLVVGGNTGDVQRELADAYLDAFAGETPRIGVSRGVLAASSRADALAQIQAQLDAGGHDLPLSRPDQDAEQFVAESYTLIGSPQDIADALAADATVDIATDLLLSPVTPVTAADFPAQIAALAVARDLAAAPREQQTAISA